MFNQTLKLDLNIYEMDIEKILKYQKVHNNFYDYSLVDHKKSNDKIEIICPIHGVFSQMPSNHLQGKGCPKCKGGVKKDPSNVISDFNKVHNNFYDYSLVVYELHVS